MMPASVPIVRVLLAFLFSILTVLPPLQSPRQGPPTLEYPLGDIELRVSSAYLATLACGSRDRRISSPRKPPITRRHGTRRAIAYSGACRPLIPFERDRSFRPNVTADSD